MENEFKLTGEAINAIEHYFNHIEFEKDCYRNIAVAYQATNNLLAENSDDDFFREEANNIYNVLYGYRELIEACTKKR